MKTTKLALASLLITAPLATMAANSCPNLTGTYAKASETLTISQTKAPQGSVVYNLQSPSGGTTTMTVGATKNQNGALGPVEQAVHCKNKQLILTSTVKTLDTLQKSVSSIDKDGNLVDKQIIARAGMPEYTQTTVYPRKN